MAPIREKKRTLLESFQAVLCTGIDVVQGRVELFGLELRAAQLSFIRVILLALGVFFCGAVGFLFGITALLLAYWDPWKEEILGIVGGVCMVLGLVGTLGLMRTLRRLPHTFSCSLNELSQDRRLLHPDKREDL